MLLHHPIHTLACSCLTTAQPDLPIRTKSWPAAQIVRTGASYGARRQVARVRGMTSESRPRGTGRAADPRPSKHATGQSSPHRPRGSPHRRRDRQVQSPRLVQPNENTCSHPASVLKRRGPHYAIHRANMHKWPALFVSTGIVDDATHLAGGPRPTRCVWLRGVAQWRGGSAHLVLEYIVALLKVSGHTGDRRHALRLRWVYRPGEHCVTAKGGAKTRCKFSPVDFFIHMARKDMSRHSSTQLVRSTYYLPWGRVRVRGSSVGQATRSLPRRSKPGVGVG